MKPFDKPQPKTEIETVRMTPAESSALARTADLLGIDKSDTIRHALVLLIRQTIRKTKDSELRKMMEK